LNGVEKAIVPHFWQSEDYPTLAIGQIPLCLAWALTIHKIQGATLSVAEMDIGQSIFEYGQTYVALSRIQSLDGLYLSAFHPQKIMANPKVVAFYNDKIAGKPSA
jgi:ATP-dependent DNA helicase PIF1